MKFNKTINIILLSACTLLTNADKVTFKVASPQGAPMVQIGEQQYQMEAVQNKPYVYKVEADVNLPVDYKYLVNSESGVYTEPFSRQRKPDEKALIDFFDRSITVKEHPLLPRAYEQFPYYKPSKLYDDTHVSSIFVKCDPTQLQGLYSNTEATGVKIPAVVTYITPYGVRVFNKAQLGLSGQSTRGVPKLSYTLKDLEDDNNKQLFNRSTIKLRAEHMDPSFLRDKLYGDVLNSLGVPTTQNKLARLYINDRPIGLFDLADDVPSGRYLRETFNEGNKYPAGQNNPIFKADYCPTCGAYGDLGYYGDDATNVKYGVYIYKGDTVYPTETDSIQQELLPLIKAINDYKMGTSNEFPFDIDLFLRYMAMEFVAGAIDNYWTKPGNYYVFKDLSKNKWYFHDADFHFSFGVGGEPAVMLQTTLAEFPPIFDQGVEKARAPLDAIRSRPENEAKFKEIFARLFATALHPDVFDARLQSLADLIREDAQWDFTLTKENPNPTLDADLFYTAEDFENHVKNENYAPNPTASFETFPIKYFVHNKVNSVAQELGIQIPAAHEDDMGYVENPSQAKGDDNKSGSVETLSWSVFSSLVALFLVMIIY